MALVTSAAASLKNTWGFSPQSIPGLQLWLDGSDSNSITGTSSVTAWRNKGAAGGSASTTNGTISSSGSINSRSALSIGTNARMTIPSLTFAQTSRTVFVVATLGGSSGTIYDFLDGTTSSVDLVFFTFGTGIFMGLVGVTATLQATFPSGSFNASSIICGVSTPASNRGLYVNGTALSLSVNSASPNGTGTFATQVTGSASNESPYTLGELLFFDGALTTQQQQQVEGYLAAKWGLKANLPATHPYSATASVPFNRPFYPTDISGCTLWMDAADRSSMTFSSGSNISRWNDKSGRGNDFTVTEGTPVLSTTTIGNPGVFLPSNSQMQSVSNAAVNGGGSRTSFFVADTPNGNEVQIGTGNIGPSKFSFGFDFNRATDPNSNFMFSPYVLGTDILFLTTPKSSLLTTTNIGFAAYNSNTTIMSGNLNFSNVDSNVTQTLTTAAGPWWMGDRPGGAETTTGFSGKTARNGWICEFIEYSGVLTTQQRQQVESYLSWKWNTTTSLPFPAGHPGRLLPAFSTGFTPKSITGLWSWLDAADTSTLVTSGGFLTQWKDKSGTNNHFDVVNANTFVVSNDNAAGYPSVVNLPNGTFSQMSSTSNITITSNFYFFGVTKITGFNTFMGYLTGAADYALRIWNNGTWILDTSGGPGTGAIGFFPVATLNGYNPPKNYSPTAFENSSPGVSGVTGAYNIFGSPFGPTNVNTKIFIAGTSIGRAVDGNFLEFLYFTQLPTLAQRQQVEGYLAWKWGLQRSLPSTHAYAKFSP